MMTSASDTRKHTLKTYRGFVHLEARLAALCFANRVARLLSWPATVVEAERQRTCGLNRCDKLVELLPTEAVAS